MKILHVSDTHLGYSAYSKITERGINQREMDTYDAFKQFVDYSFKSKPDLIIHSGDLFDSVRPNNRAITFAIKQILKLSKNNIPFIVIAGNHEHPRLKETGHIFSILDHIENVYPVYKEKYEPIILSSNGKELTVHAIPQSSTKDEFIKNLDRIEINTSSNYNILLTHGSIKDIKVFSMNEFNELFIPKKYLKLNFDYIALGHFHKYSRINQKTYYAGSTECFTFADANEKKGFIELVLSDRKINHKFIRLKNRSMIDITPINCSNLKVDEVMVKIKKTIDQINPKDKIFRIILQDIPSHIYRGIDFREIRKISSDAVHFEIKTDIIKDEYSNLIRGSKLDALSTEFKIFMKNQNIAEKENLLRLGLDYISKIETKKEEK